LKPALRDSRALVPAAAGLWGVFLGGSVASRWATSPGYPGSSDFWSYSYSLLTGLPTPLLLLLVAASLASAVAGALALRRLLSRGKSAQVVVGGMLLVAAIFGGNAGLLAFAAPPSPQPTTSTCTYQVSANADSVSAWSAARQATVLSDSGDLGALVSSLPQTNQVLCFAPGSYTVDSTLKVFGQSNVSLLFSPGAVMTAGSPLRMLEIAWSTGVVVDGGRWIGGGSGNFSNIQVDPGTNHITVEGIDSSNAGRDGIIIRNDTTPALQVSVLDNYVHNNHRFGIQDIENTTSQSLNVLISGNLAEDNSRGGIYTNGAGGVHIVGNTVRNTVGTKPGVIGIGVTNGANDTVVGNHVSNMSEYGIQVFYNNNTLVENNYSGFNAGYSDQSGITNDHSSYDTIVNNTVVSNGLSGVHVERSWYVTVSGNNATANGRFGIEFYHGSIATDAHETVVANVCSRNAQAGIIFNSGVDSLIASNKCLDNSGPGIYLYNDPGQAGSSGNIIANNTLGDDRGSPSARTQTYGIEAVNAADGNILQGNSLFNNTVSAISVSGVSNVVEPAASNSGASLARPAQ